MFLPKEFPPLSNQSSQCSDAVKQHYQFKAHTQEQSIELQHIEKGHVLSKFTGFVGQLASVVTLRHMLQHTVSGSQGRHTQGFTWKKKVEIPMLYNKVYIKKCLFVILFFQIYQNLLNFNIISKNHQLQIFTVTYVLGSGRLNKNKQKMLYCSHRA